MPPRPGQGQPLLRVADGGVDPSVENHLHPSASPVRELPGDFVLTICVHRESSMGNGKQFSRLNTKWFFSLSPLTNLELCFPGINIDTAMIPSWPNCVVDTEEHHHVLASKTLIGMREKKGYPTLRQNP